MSASRVSSLGAEALFDGSPALTLGDAALIYAALGWAILPVAPRSKRPLVAGGWRSATADRARITAWWDDHPEANIGYRPEGRVVVDSDAPDAPRGGLHLPPTAVVRSGRGHHYFYVADRNVHSRNGVRPGLDIKGSDGYVLLPPSVHPSGEIYEWLISPESMVEAPAWIYEATARRSQRTDEPPTGQPILEGDRESYLSRLFGAMRRHGATADEMLGAGRVLNRRCVPPLYDRDLQRIAASIARYEPALAIAAGTGSYARAGARGRRTRTRDRASPRDTATRPIATGRWRPEPRWSNEEFAERMADAPVPSLPPPSDARLGRLADDYQRITGQPVSSPRQWNTFADAYRVHGDDLLPYAEALFRDRGHANNLLGLVRTSPPRRGVER